MQLTEGYKQTEVGIIPEDWEVNPIGLIGNVIRGASPRPKGDKRYYGGKIPRLMVEDITRDKHWVTPCVDYLTEAGAKQSRPCKAGTLVLACSGTAKAVGLPALLAIDACIHDGILGLVQLGQKYSPNFLFHLLGSLQQRLFDSATHGGTFVNLTTDGLRAFCLPLPPTKAEQEAIAEVLSDTDAWIESLEQLIAKKRRMKEGSMQALLTGKQRLPGFSGEWKVKSLGNLGKCYRGVSYSPVDLSTHDTESTVRLLRSNNVQQSSIIFSDMQYVDAGRVSEHQYLQEKDILICMANGSRRLVGKAGQFRYNNTRAYTFGAFMGAFRPDLEEADPNFVFGIFSTEAYRAHIDLLLAGSSINNLTPKSVEQLEIPVPAEKAEQTAIATILSDMDSELDALEAKLSKARQIKQGMMQELLTGKTRLV